MSIKKRKWIVIQALHEDPATRWNDDLLEKKIWSILWLRCINFDNKKFRMIPNDRSNIPSRDVITRCRRKIQESWLYDPIDPVIKAKRRAYSKKVLSDLMYNVW